MRLTAKDNNVVAVLDDVMQPEQFKQFWAYFNSLDFAFRSMSGWVKVWKINDGQILAGMCDYHSKAPFNSPLDWLHNIVIALAKEHFSDIVGKEGEDWTDVVLTPYVYPSGTKISWHDDYGYSGACIFYTHPTWDPHWGGELMIAKTPPAEDVDESRDKQANSFTREHYASLLNAQGMGLYFSPLPNRMIFTQGKTWHSINRVDQSAGDNVRASFVAFFLKPK